MTKKIKGGFFHMKKQELQQEILERRRQEKKQVVYNTTNTIIDKTTGEILRQDTEQKTRTTTEPAFIKIYYKAMLAVNGIEGLPLDFVLALASVITYCNDDSPIYFYNNKTNRRMIAECCLKKDGKPISDNMVARYIKKAKDLSLLFDTGDKGIYMVNACMLAKGHWKNISKLQASFDFTGNKWERIMEIQEKNESDTDAEPTKEQEAS